MNILLLQAGQFQNNTEEAKISGPWLFEPIWLIKMTSVQEGTSEAWCVYGRHISQQGNMRSLERIPP